MKVFTTALHFISPIPTGAPARICAQALVLGSEVQAYHCQTSVSVLLLRIVLEKLRTYKQAHRQRYRSHHHGYQALLRRDATMLLHDPNVASPYKGEVDEATCENSNHDS